MHEVISEFGCAKEKCFSITEIDGEPAHITELHLRGKTSVETIRITYRSGDLTRTKTYHKNDFYALK